MNVTIAVALRFVSEAVFARSPNAAAIIVSTTGFFWFLSHSLLITRVGEKKLNGDRTRAIAITVGLTLVQVIGVLVFIAFRAFAQFQR